MNEMPPPRKDTPPPEDPKTRESLKDIVKKAFPDIPQPTRRQMIIGGGAAAGVGAVGLGTYELLKSKGHEKTAPFHRGEFSTGELAGIHVADLFAFYLGLPEHSAIPEKLDPDFGAVMHDLWQKKLAFVQRKKPSYIDNNKRGEEHFGYSYEQKWRESTITPQTLSEFLQDAQENLEKTKAAFDWGRFRQRPEYNHSERGPEEFNIVKEMADNVTAEMLIAYSVTELLPYAAKDREDNEKLRRMPLNVYELLLEHAGSEFLVDLPSSNDPYLSTGIFQFSSFALFDDGHKKEGASVMNQYLSNENVHIPSSVLQLDTAEKQFRAAYLFAIYNLAQMARITATRGNKHQIAGRMERLARTGAQKHVGLLQYIASAHHNPAEAVGGFIAWNDAGFEGKHSDYCGARVRDYVRSAHTNYEEIRRKVGSS